MKQFVINYNANCEKCKKEPSECEIDRTNFYIDCLPTINMMSSNVNIIDFDGKYFIKFDPRNDDNNYILNKNFTLEKFKGDKPTDTSFSTLLELCESKIDSNLTIEKTEVPIFYMFTDISKVFDLFAFFSIKTKTNIDELNTIDNIFQFDYKTNKFFKMSFNFNILNLSMMCGKFFEVYPYLVSDKLSEKELIDKLKKIFAEYDIGNLCIIINEYYKKIQLLKNDFRKKVMMGKYGHEPMIDSKTFVGREKEKENVDHLLKLEKRSGVLSLDEEAKKEEDLCRSMLNKDGIDSKIINSIIRLSQENLGIILQLKGKEKDILLLKDMDKEMIGLEDVMIEKIQEIQKIEKIRNNIRKEVNDDKSFDSITKLDNDAIEGLSKVPLTIINVILDKKLDNEQIVSMMKSGKINDQTIEMLLKLNDDVLRLRLKLKQSTMVKVIQLKKMGYEKKREKIIKDLQSEKIADNIIEAILRLDEEKIGIIMRLREYEKIRISLGSEGIDGQTIETILGLKDLTVNNLTQFKKNNKIANMWHNLAKEVYVVNKNLNKIAQYIPDFPNLFMMSYLSHRMKEKYINGLWGFCFGNLQEYIEKHTSKKIEYATKKDITEHYKQIQPILYTHQTVTFENETYANCMENVLLQFLKIIFWNDKKKKYDVDMARELINETNKLKIINFIERITTEERSDEFTKEWVSYVTEIMRKYGDNPDKLKKIFVRNNDNKKIAKELNAILSNLIMFLEYIFIDEWKKDGNDVLKMIIDKKAKIEDAEYNIAVNSETDKDTNVINLHSQFTIILENKHHAQFVGAILDGESINIIMHINNKSNKSIKFPESLSHISNRWISYKNINAYMCTNISLHAKNSIIVQYINNTLADKKLIYYDMLFDEGIDKIIGEPISFLKYDIDKSVLFSWISDSAILAKLRDNNFWIDFLKKYELENAVRKEMMKIWGSVVTVKSDAFWGAFMKNIDIKYIDDMTEEWEYTVVIEVDSFWDAFMKYVANDEKKLIIIMNYWGVYTTNIKSELFWKLFTNDIILKDENKINVILEKWDATRFIKSDSFWNIFAKHIMKHKKYINILTREWKTTTKIRSDTFWNVFMEYYKDVVNMMLLKWEFTIYIVSDVFWRLFMKNSKDDERNINIIIKLWQHTTKIESDEFWSAFIANTKNPIINAKNIDIMMKYWADTTVIRSDAFWKIFVENISWDEKNIILFKDTWEKTTHVRSDAFWNKFVNHISSNDLDVIILKHWDDTIYNKSDSFWKIFVDKINKDKIIDILRQQQTLEIDSAVFWKFVKNYIEDKKIDVTQIDSLVLDKMNKIVQHGGNSYSNYVRNKMNYMKIST